jgi:hypothetical protein
MPFPAGDVIFIFRVSFYVVGFLYWLMFWTLLLYRYNLVLSFVDIFWVRNIQVYPRTYHESPEGKQSYSSTLSLTSALDGVGGQRHSPAALPAGKRSFIHCIRDWVGSRAGLDGCGKSCPHRDSIPGPSSPLRVAVPTTPSQPRVRNIFAWK